MVETTNHNHAEQDWSIARRKLLYEKVVCRFKTRTVDLLSFENVRSTLNIHQSFERGLHTIPISNIQGSVGRLDDFSSRFLPLKESGKERWIGVDIAVTTGKTAPIDVYQVGQVYYVLDGNHRVSVARLHGFETIEAYVTEFPLPADFIAGDGMDKHLIKSERTRFLDQIGEENLELARQIRFTCPGCFRDISRQIHLYQQTFREQYSTELSFGEAFLYWHDDAYWPLVKAIQKNNLLDHFSNRTEGDLYIWSWRNSRQIEALELSSNQ